MATPTTPTLEERVAKLEAQMARVRQHLPEHAATSHWVDAVFGLCQDDPDFDEMVRLGREYRAAQVPEYPGDGVSA